MKSNKIVMVILGLGLLAACTREPVAAPTPTPSAVTITYVCNAGFILETGDYKILVDALFQREDFCDPQLTPRMRAALPPFDGADLVLVSHKHGDHFDPQIVGEYLSLTPGAHTGRAGRCGRCARTSLRRLRRDPGAGDRHSRGDPVEVSSWIQ